MTIVSDFPEEPTAEAGGEDDSVGIEVERRLPAGKTAFAARAEHLADLTLALGHEPCNSSFQGERQQHYKTSVEAR